MYALRRQSCLLTHGAVEAVDACRYFAALLFGALRGEDKSALLSPYYSPFSDYWKRFPLCPAIDGIARGEYKPKSRDQINSSAYVVLTLEAALWAFHRSNDFRAGLLEAVNLAGDADAVGSVFGQIAGAHYGEMTIPYRSISWLTEAHGFTTLLRTSWRHQGSSAAAVDRPHSSPGKHSVPKTSPCVGVSIAFTSRDKRPGET